MGDFCFNFQSNNRWNDQNNKIHRFLFYVIMLSRLPIRSFSVKMAPFHVQTTKIKKNVGNYAPNRNDQPNNRKFFSQFCVVFILRAPRPYHFEIRWTNLKVFWRNQRFLVKITVSFLPNLSWPWKFVRFPK